MAIKLLCVYSGWWCVPTFQVMFSSISSTSSPIACVFLQNWCCFWNSHYINASHFGNYALVMAFYQVLCQMLKVSFQIYTSRLSLQCTLRSRSTVSVRETVFPQKIGNKQSSTSDWERWNNEIHSSARDESFSTISFIASLPNTVAGIYASAFFVLSRWRHSFPGFSLWPAMLMKFLHSSSTSQSYCAGKTLLYMCGKSHTMRMFGCDVQSIFWFNTQHGFLSSMLHPWVSF